MGVIQRVVKPRNKKSRRALESKEPKAVENSKTALMLKGLKCSQEQRTCLKDLCALKKPLVIPYQKKNDIRPFENIHELEVLASKTDSSLFLFANHNKKRPHNLIFGRMFDGHLLDMVEVGLSGFRSLSDFKNEKIASGTKPCLLFSGNAFQRVPELIRFQSLLIDFFRGPTDVTHVRLSGIEHAFQFTALSETEIAVRSYKIVLKRSGTTNVPRVELEEIGPSMNMKLRRSHLASDELTKLAETSVKNLLKRKKTKNVSKDELDNTLGRVHVPSQNISKIQTRKMKGLKKGKEEAMETD